MKKDGRYTGTVVPWRDPETGDTVEIGRGIVTPGEQAKILRSLEERAAEDRRGRRRGLRAPSSHLMTGLIFCGSCGGRMSASGKSYVCQAKRLGKPCPNHVTAYAPAVDEAVFFACVATLTACEPGDPLMHAVAERWVEQHDPEAVEHRATIALALSEAEASLADLEVARYLRGEFKGTDAIKRWERLHDRLAARVAGLRRDLDDHPLPEANISPLLDGVLVREAWEAADLTDRRDLLALALDQVVVLPAEGRGRRFDPATRLAFAWAAPEVGV